MSTKKMFGLGGSLASLLMLTSCMTTPAEEMSAPAASSTPASAAASAPSSVMAELQAMSLDIPYTKYVLGNGLTLIVHEDHKTPTVNVQVYYHVGSKNEPKGRSGFAHLFEHLMFNGSQHFNDDFFKATQKIGATNQNGTTNTDRTNYYQTVPTEGLDAVLWLESDRMGYLLGAVDQARLDEQRGVVKNEKRQGENQPYGQVNNHTVAATYPEEHPYGHTVIGSMDDLDAAKLEDVRDWFRTWYGPSNAVLVLAGDISAQEAKTKVEKYFGEIPSGPPVSHPKSWVPRLADDQREIMYDRVPAPRIYRVWNVPELGHADGEPLDAFAYALAGDKNSRLTKRLVYEEEVATNVVASNGQSELAGQFRIIVLPKPDADLSHIEQVIDEEMAKLLEAGPTADELEKAKVQTMRGIVDSLERAPSKAQMLATWQTYTGDPSGWKTSLDRLLAATPQQVAAIGRKWLDKGSYTLTVLPFGDYKAFAQPVDRSAMPRPEGIADAAFPKYETATLSNGIKLLVAERHDTPLVNIQMLMETGLAPDWAELNSNVGGLAVSLLDEGTKSRTALEIADQLDRLGASVNAGGGDMTTISMSSLTATLDPVLDIYADIVRNPAFREEDFERVKRQQVQSYRQLYSQPAGIAQMVLMRKIWGDNHPNGRIPLVEDLEKVSRADVEAFYRRWFGPNNATLVVVGDTTLAEIAPKLEAAFRNWAPAPGARIKEPPGTRPDKTRVYLVDRPGSLQSVIVAGTVLPPLDAKQNFRERLFNDLFGGNFTSRINMNLREDKGWSYGSRSGISSGRGPRTFSISAPVQTDATKGALEELRKELTRIVGKSPPSAEELEDARTNAILGLTSRWETGGAVASSLAGTVVYDFPPDYFQNYAESLREVTLGEVLTTSKTILPNQNLVWVVVGDLEKIEKGVRSLGLGEVTVVDAHGDPA